MFKVRGYNENLPHIGSEATETSKHQKSTKTFCLMLRLLNSLQNISKWEQFDWYKKNEHTLAHRINRGFR